MMRMFRSFVCISTLRVFSEVAGSWASTASGSARLFPFDGASSAIDRVSAVFAATDPARSPAARRLFRR